jgi:primosomal protein N' (replication factor Y)
MEAPVAAASYAEVAFPIPVRQSFTYAIPTALQGRVLPGCRVHAPFGKGKTSLGYVTALRDECPAGVEHPKELADAVDAEPLFSPTLLAFLNWVADYYLASQGEVYAAAYPFAPDCQPKRVQTVCLYDKAQTEGTEKELHFEVQRKVVQFLITHGGAYPQAALMKELEISSSPIQSLEKKGWVRIESRETLRRPSFTQAEDASSYTLTFEQEQAILQIERVLGHPSPKPILIQGVTGSGKTEVYLQAIERVLRRGRNALVLIPEISLTPQTMDRFRLRFGDQVGILHSALGAGERFDEWRLAKQGVRRILVGTRSAIFAPMENLGIIIVDEEHEGSYKQSDPSPRYNGRDLAVARAFLGGALCVLGSATPAVESTYNARLKKYQSIRLMQRVSSHGLPQITLLDMRGRTEEEEILAHELQTALYTRFERKQQSILFLNRRGFATTLTCKKCGQILRCKHCSVAVVYHRSHHILACHHCEYRAPMPSACPECNDPFIQQRGFGTERVVADLETWIPGVRVIRMDRDTTSGKGDHDRLLSAFRRGEADILVGTQMIAKGLDFPNVTLVGIINADATLSIPDFRAAERTFTLLTQVAGRAGRGEHAGEVFIQSYCPDHYSMQLALTQDYDQFYEKEIRYRHLIGFPPFTRLVLWRIEARQEDYARGKAWELYELLKAGGDCAGVTILPPVEAPIYRIRDYYRWQVALKSRDYKLFRPVVNQPAVVKLLSTRRKDLRIVQDIDPWEML